LSYYHVSAQGTAETRDIDIAIMSVCPSHAGILWKRFNILS